MEELEDWQLDFEWLQIRHYIKDTLGSPKLPDFQGILFLLGVQELGQLKEEFTKEEKQDLMHIAVCHLLSEDGYYEFEGFDDAGWPHFKQLGQPPYKGVEAQERFLKIKIIKYFKEQQDYTPSTTYYNPN
ncbi:MAG: hypothetical protein GY810_25490 [Aureispira sp.]|nr:hypothetical protein [Aureispira sp.]